MPKLADVLPVLDASGLRYCLLRSGSHEPGPGERQEVDLLVAPGDAAKFALAADSLGFVPLPMWGYEPHRSYIAYEAARGWLVLDAVTDLRFGRRVQPVRIDLVEDCLARRRATPDGQRPAPEHELVLLLLHCLLDKEAFPARHRARLAAVQVEVVHDPAEAERTADTFARHLAPALDWQAASRAISAGDWAWLLARRGAVRRELVRRAPLTTAGRWVSARAKLGLRPLLIALRWRGSAMVLLGSAGGRPSTVARTLSGDRDLRARVVTSWVGVPLGVYHRLRGRRVLYDLTLERDRRLVPGGIPQLDLECSPAAPSVSAGSAEELAYRATELWFDHDRRRLRAEMAHDDHRTDQR